jgi:hypothetical protein
MFNKKKEKRSTYSSTLISVSSSHDDADLRETLLLSASTYQMEHIDNRMAVR